MARSIVKHGRRRAVALVEAAVTFTLLFWLVLGVIEYGWLILKYQQITNAVRQGARIGARVDADTADVEDTVRTVLEAAGMPGYTPTVEPGVGGLAGGDRFEVKLEVVYADIGLGMPLIPTPEKLVSRVTMAKEGI